jgi:transposase
MCRKSNSENFSPSGHEAGWYRKVEVKGHSSQALRALLIARAQVVSQITTLKSRERGMLKVFGHVLPKKLRPQFIPKARPIKAGDAILMVTVEPLATRGRT